MSQEQTNIVLGGRGARSRCNGRNAENAIVFHNSLNVSQGLLASIVAASSKLLLNHNFGPTSNQKRQKGEATKHWRRSGGSAGGAVP